MNVKTRKPTLPSHQWGMLSHYKLSIPQMPGFSMKSWLTDSSKVIHSLGKAARRNSKSSSRSMDNLATMPYNPEDAIGKKNEHVLDFEIFNRQWVGIALLRFLSTARPKFIDRPLAADRTARSRFQKIHMLKWKRLFLGWLRPILHVRLTCPHHRLQFFLYLNTSCWTHDPI